MLPNVNNHYYSLLGLLHHNCEVVLQFAHADRVYLTGSFLICKQSPSQAYGK